MPIRRGKGRFEGPRQGEPRTQSGERPGARGTATARHRPAELSLDLRGRVEGHDIRRRPGIPCMSREENRHRGEAAADLRHRVLPLEIRARGPHGAKPTRSPAS